jgi:hypothetical protein
VTEPTPLAPPETPTFGRRTTPLERRRFRPFAVEVETADDRFDVPFEAYFDVDAGAALGIMNARTEMQQANAVAQLMHVSLRNDDGVPFGWIPPATPELSDPDDEESDWQRAEAPEGEEGEPLYMRWDGELVPSDGLDYDPLEDGSSRLRFAFVMDSPEHRVQLGALNEIAEWIIGDAAKRPTRRPTPSGRGQQRTSRGSGARRR